MLGVKITVLRYISDDPQPGIVEFQWKTQARIDAVRESGLVMKNVRFGMALVVLAGSVAFAQPQREASSALEVFPKHFLLHPASRFTIRSANPGTVINLAVPMPSLQQRA
jgi:hypothetical protein